MSTHHFYCECKECRDGRHINQLKLELSEMGRERDENAKGWKDVRECLERVAAERDALRERMIEIVEYQSQDEGVK